MSDYFDPSINRIAAGSLAKSEQVNNLRDETGIGFDMLPPPDMLNQGRTTFAADTGSVNQYEIELASTVNAYETHLTVSMIPSHDNTGASTLNVNGLGAVAIKDNDGDDLHAGVLITTGVNSFTYNGTHFVLAGVTSAALEGLTSEAESARDIAVASATAAGISEVSADADATQVALDRIQTTADATQTASDRVQTGLDRVQTGLDRASSTTSASDAAASAATIDVAKLAGIEDNATRDQTTITGNAGSATSLETPRTIGITGDITATAVVFDGTANIAISAAVNNNSHTHNSSTVSSCSGNSASATQLATARTISLSGDCSGSGTYNGTATTTIPVVVANDSHTHTYSTLSMARAHGSSGFVTLPSGTIIQWGANFSLTTQQSKNIYYPLAFPSYCANVTISDTSRSDALLSVSLSHTPHRTYFTATNSGGGSTKYAFWIAIGY